MEDAADINRFDPDTSQLTEQENPAIQTVFNRARTGYFGLPQGALPSQSTRRKTAPRLAPVRCVPINDAL